MNNKIANNKQQFKKVLMMVIIILTIFSFSTIAYAAEGGGGTELDPLTAIDNLTEFIVGIISAVGVIALAWGAVQLALALHSGDQSQKTSAMLFLAGGAIMVGVRFLVQAIGVKI